VVFNENVNGINNSTFLVRQENAAANLDGIVEYDSSSRTATFTNKSVDLMLFNTSYTVTLKSDVILDDAGKPLDSGQTTTDYIFTYNTGDAPIINISAGQTGDINQHFLVVDYDGRAASVWRQEDATNVRIYASLFENGSWQPATILADIPFSSRTNDIILKGLVSNSSNLNDNDFAVQWSRKDSSTTLTHNYVSIYNKFNGWTGQDTPVSNGLDNASNLLLTTNGNEYVSVWIQSISIQSGMIRSRFYTSAWSTIVDVASTRSASALQLTSNGDGYGLGWLDSGLNADTMGNEDTVTVVYFDFYDGNWSMQPTRVSLQASKPGGVIVEPEGMRDFSYRPRISSNGNYYALNWYGQDVDGKSRIFSSVMTGILNNSRDIIWNGPLRLSANGNPSNNIIVSSKMEYLSTWDAADINNQAATSYVYDNHYKIDITNPSDLGDWLAPPMMADNTNLGTAESPLPFGTNSGYAMVWTKTGGGINDGDTVGRVYLNGTWQAGTLLGNTSLGKSSGLTINGSGDKFIAAWTQGQNEVQGSPVPPFAVYVNRYDGTSWHPVDKMRKPQPLPLEGTSPPTTSSSDVKTVPLGNGHYMATWLKEVTLGGAKRLDSKFVQAP